MMNCIARALAVSGVVPLLAGCADGSRRQHGESAMGKELIGTWDITFHLERSPGLVTDTLSVKRDVRGSLALLANRSENRYPGVGEPVNYGTYDIDFTGFGFDVRDAGKIPTVAIDSAAKDSIEIVLSHEPGDISVRMEGGIRRDTVSGTWQVAYPRLGAGGGSFFMTPRRTRKF